MKVLIDYFGPPFHLAHGGLATQIHGTIRGLMRTDVQADYARWWDGNQNYDLVHTFGIPTLEYLQFAKDKKIPVVCTNLFTAACNRSLRRMNWNGVAWRTYELMGKTPVIGHILSNQFRQSLLNCDACIVGLEAEAQVLIRTYGISRERIHIVPLATDETFLKGRLPLDRENWLITTGTITQRKRSLELARLAHKSKVPIHFVGKPYSFHDEYWKEFSKLVDDKFVMHTHHVNDTEAMRNLLSRARGFVLYSDFENWCLSAHEADACGLPMLLPDQPWSRERFGVHSSYFDSHHSLHSSSLENFYHDESVRLECKIRHFTWDEVGENLFEVYNKVKSSL